MVHVRNAVLTQANGFRWSLSDKPPASDSEWYVEDVAGWYGGSGVRGDVTARLGHGDFVERGYREGRVLTLHGTVVCSSPDIRDWQERNISGMAGDGDWCELTCDDGNAELSTRVRLDGAPQVVKMGTQALRFQVPLRTELPFLYSAWRESSLQPVGAGVGFEFAPFTGGEPVPGPNLVVDPQGLDADVTAARTALNPGWAFTSGAGYWRKDSALEGSNTFRLNYPADARSDDVAVVAGRRYRMRFDAWLDGGTAQSRFALSIRLKDGSTTYTGDGPETGGDAAHYTDIPSGDWVTVERFWDAPADAVSASFEVQLNSVTSATTDMRIRNFEVTELEPADPIIRFGTAVAAGDRVWNDGNATSAPVFTVYADSAGFAVGLGNRRVTYPWPTFQDVPVTVDMAGAVTIGGVDQSHLLGERNWSTVPPSGVESPVFSFLNGGNGWATVRHRDTYL